MKVLFKNTTKYTKENRNNFVEFHNNKYGVKELLNIIFLGIVMLYMLILNLIWKNWIFILIIAITIGILYTLEKNTKEKKERSKVKEFTFYFYKKHIKIKYKKEFERLKYFQLHKIFETDEYFFLYLDEKSSMILSKKGFEIGTANEFSQFIKHKCPLKYRNENKI